MLRRILKTRQRSRLVLMACPKTSILIPFPIVFHDTSQLSSRAILKHIKFLELSALDLRITRACEDIFMIALLLHFLFMNIS